MGVIIKQTIKGSFWSYLGAFLGFINTGLLFPKIFRQDEIGIIFLFVSIALIVSNVSSLGMNGVITRLFPYFRAKDKGHNGFPFILFSSFLIGSLLVILFLVIFKNVLSNQFAQYSLYDQYKYLLFPLIIFLLSFTLLDNYSKALYNAVQGIFLKEVVVRVLNSGLIILYYFKIIELGVFIVIYFCILAIPSIFLLIRLVKDKDFNLKPQFSFLDKDMKRRIAGVAVFSLFGGFGGVFYSNIDKYMIGSYLSLADVGVYGIAAYISTLIALPSRAMLKISSTVIAESWKVNDLVNIQQVYKKSSLNLFIIGNFILLFIIVNLDSMFIYLDEYKSGMYVIIFLGVANIVDMVGGVASTVIASSKYYQQLFYLLLIFIAAVIISNYFFIPRYGILGAAIASLLAQSIFVGLKMFFIYKKFGMSIFTFGHLKVLFIIIFIIFGFRYVPNLQNVFLNVFVRSSIMVLSYGLLNYFWRTSDDIISLISITIHKIKQKYA